MSGRLQDFDADRDRSDPQSAEQLFDLLWPTRDIKIVCARRLAESIRYAHNRQPASWSISMFDQSINLNVGQVQVLQFKPGEIFVYARLARGKSVYNAVSVPCDRFLYFSDKVTSIPPQRWKSHERFIDAAAEAKKTSPFRRAFSEGVMLQLERHLQTTLPRPRYLHSAVEEDDNTVESGLSLAAFDLPAASEGRRQLIAHYRIERNRNILEDKKDAVKNATGALACEVCSFDFRIYKGLGDGFCEVHHLRPLSEVTSAVETSLNDLAIVCANCHRMIHRNGQARTLASVRASLKF